MQKQIIKTLFFCALFGLPILQAQNVVEEQLSAHVYYLSDDKLEGRATGSEGEKMALDYISTYFKEYGLQAKGSNGFQQAFDFTLGKKVTEVNKVLSAGNTLEIGTDYFPLIYSGNGDVQGVPVDVSYGIHAPGLRDDFSAKDLNGRIFLINLSSPDGIHPHSKYKQYTDSQAFGASAVIFYNEDENLDDPKFDLTMNVKEFDIPVIFIKDKTQAIDKNMLLQIDLKKEERTGHNVVAFLDNNADKTVVIGAHYDHLGWGESGGSLYRGEPAIHNGADDNASGVALMLELAGALKKANLTGNNYLFIAFSGEELGLYGSKSFVQDATIDVNQINYMINFDMVGRLDEENTMAVNGVGTSPIFKSKTTSIQAGNIKVKTTESGMGPSDHASFYLADKPVLHLYTGNNPDYHKPSDDAYLINFEGMALIYDYTLALIQDLDDEGRLEFVKTKDEDNRNAPKFSVTLGVVPDYMYDGEGMRIDGVTEGKPAFNAVVLTGDVVKKLGDIDITDMMAYMTALSKFKKGDQAIVRVLRDNKLLDLDITF